MHAIGRMEMGREMQAWLSSSTSRGSRSACEISLYVQLRMSGDEYPPTDRMERWSSS